LAANDDERLETFTTVRDWFRHAVSRFQAAKLAFGHGAANAIDEAAFIVLEGLSLPIDALDPFLDARLTKKERERLQSLVDARVETRKPAAYLLNRAYIQGVPFYVDERVIVPRSFIGELLFAGLAGSHGLIDDPQAILSVLDFCTGGGSLAILAAQQFEDAVVDAVDVSKDALEVAKRNVEMHKLAARINLLEGDGFAPVAARRYDLILANPPYVLSADVDAFPPEFAAEPRIAHDGGADGLAIVRRLLAGAPEHLTRDGLLVCEIGQGRRRVEAAFPALPFLWLDTAECSGEVFALRAKDFGAHGKGKRGARA